MTGILLLCTGMLGCDDFLTVDIPDQLLKKDYWKSRDQLDAALNGVYVGLGSCITRYIRWGDFRSHLYTENGNTADADRRLIRHDIVTTNSNADWSQSYMGINYANSFLANAEEVLKHDFSVTPEEVTSMKGEVYALRALHYFYLVRAFQDVPVWKEPYESDAQPTTAPALPMDEVLDFIEEDLKIALRDAPEEFVSPEEHYGRITKNAVKALWADVKLWRGGDDNYRSCIALCEELEEVYTNRMVDAESWFSIFSVGNSGESIFEYQYLDSRYSSNALFTLFYNTDPNYIGYVLDVRKAYPSRGNFITTDTVRMQRTIGAHHLYGVLFPYIMKQLAISAENAVYVMRDGEGRAKLNFIFYRFREVLLMKAEALAMLEEYEEALKPVNTIRRATGLPEAIPAEFGSGELFLDKLICERTAELGYEGKQWFTLVRIALNSGYHTLLVDRIASTSMDINELVLKGRLTDPRGWFLPYYRDEVQNRNRELKQKEFYKSKEA